jgi:hypothetical protein
MMDGDAVDIKGVRDLREPRARSASNSSRKRAASESPAAESATVMPRRKIAHV